MVFFIVGGRAKISRAIKSIIFLIALTPSFAFTEASLYLPLQLSPTLENKVEQLFVLANMPIIKRPIPISEVQVALEKVDEKYPEIADSIRRHLKPYSQKSALSHLQATFATSNGDPVSLANARGDLSTSQYQASFAGHWAAADWLVFNVGGFAYEGPDLEKNIFAENTFISLGSEALQLDVGYRPHWFGPFQESDMLISTHAASAPGLTLSNTTPFDFLGFRYELFWVQMSESDKILSEDRSQRLTGDPKLLGLHLSIEPLAGFAIGINRLMQYGGANRDESVNGLMKAFFRPRKNDNLNIEEDGEHDGADFGNQLLSVTTRYTFVGDFPMSVYMMYAGEDTSSAAVAALGNTSLMLGLHMPMLTSKLNFTYEYASWQNAWYVNGVFGDGLRNYDTIMGHWAASRREFADAVGATSHMAKLIWAIDSEQMLLFKYSRVENEPYSAQDYKIGNEFSADYSRPWQDFSVGVSLMVGNSVFDERYSRMTGYIRW